MTFYLALRNIIRNKRNSILIVFLVAVITFLFFIGNSIIGRVDRSIRNAYVEGLTGDVVIQKSGDISMNLFGANTPVIEEFFTLPVMPAYDAAAELIAAESALGGMTSQVSGNAYLDLYGVREPALLCGIDVESYFSLFPGIILDEGRFLQSGEYGAMITSERADRINTLRGRRPVPGDPMLLTSGGQLGFKIREVPLVGIYHYRNSGQLMNEIIIIDPQTVRALNSIQVASTGKADEVYDVIPPLGSLDDLFGEDDFDTSGDIIAEQPFSAEFLQSFIKQETGEEELSGGDWNFIILRLKERVPTAAFIKKLNAKINPYGLTASGWRTAAGMSAMFLLLVQALFNLGVVLISLAGIITVINLLLISVFRRNREIGTLRAIGASDAYIRSLILTENLLLSLCAGFAGVCGGFFFLRWINRIGIVITNDLIVSFLGGSSVLQVEFLPPVAALSFAVAAVLGLLASVYPVETAVRINPIQAVQQG
ncbi:ABC transporter permease [Spirochaetia bacterium]|nr:ABC transporter permease [Spirochaetia bacterium]